MARYQAKGAQLSMGNGASPEVFTAIAQLTKIGAMSLVRATLDTSDHDTVNAKTFLGDKLYDGGEVPIEGHYDPAAATHGNTSGVLKAFTNGVAKNFKIIFPDAGTTTFSFSGIMTKVSPGDAPYDGKLTFTATVKVTGAPTLV